MDLPRCFRSNVIQDLKSYPQGLNLRDLSPYFFDSALFLLSFIQDDQLKAVLIATYKARLLQLMKKAYSNSVAESLIHAEHQMEELEKRLFHNASRISHLHQQWINSKPECRRLRAVAKLFVPSMKQ